MYSAKIIADSVSPAGVRLTTFEFCYWRAVHDELMTHREFSRNTASARAIPIEKMIAGVLEDPALPLEWGSNKPGMQPGDEISADQIAEAKRLILGLRDQAVKTARALTTLGLHKQIVNRYLQPWMFTTVLVSATSYGNFFKLRCDKMAQAEIRHVAKLARGLMETSKPRALAWGAWHLPLIDKEDWTDAIQLFRDDPAYLDKILQPAGEDQPEAPEQVAFPNPPPLSPADFLYSRAAQWLLIKVSVARCARVSYLRHLEKRDLRADAALHNILAAAGHWSPFEHIAQALMNPKARSGNFRGWAQYRKLWPTEYHGGESYAAETARERYSD